MSDRVALEALPREVFGKKVKNLRNEGIVPAVIYGKTQEPVHIQMSWPDLRVALRDAGGTSLINIDVDGEKFAVLARDVHRHPVRQDVVLHVDFYAVNLKEKLVATVPVVFEGEQGARDRSGGRLLFDVTTIDVQTFPDKIPSEIVVSLDVLEEIGDAIAVSELPKLEDLEYLLEPEATIVKLDYLREELEEPEEEEIEMPEMGSVEPEVLTGAKEDEEEIEE